MIVTQLIPRGIKDKRLLQVFENIQRDLFVPDNFAPHAYEDHPLPIGENQTISQPFMQAWMTELLELTGKEKVLEIGTGSGYQTAILAELSRLVYSVEILPALSMKAQITLGTLGYKNIFFKIYDGTQGWSEKSPFDRIIVTAGASFIPPPLFEQLIEGGRMVIPVGEPQVQNLILARKIKGKMVTEDLGKCVFVPLVGKYGMKN